MEIDTATLLIAICANSLACIGLIVACYFHTDSKITALGKQINDEMKDFHGRLCALEERYIAFKMEQK